MILADDLTDRRGRVLAPKGATLSARTLEALEGWGIEQVDVEGDAEEAPEIDPEDLKRVKADLAGRFHRTDLDHPFVAALLDRAALVHLQRRGASGRANQPV